MTKYYCNACDSKKPCYHECDNNEASPALCLYDECQEPGWLILENKPEFPAGKIKFCEAALKMKHGDIFETCVGIQNIEAYHKGDIAGIWYRWTDGKKIDMTAGVLEIEGEIIPAEPKVLTADEIVQKVTDEDPDNRKPYRRLMYECTNYAHQNGRLERDLELRQFVQYIKDFCKSLDSEGFKKDAERILEQIEIIPPLNQD